MENDTLPENWSWSTIKEIADPNSKAIVSGPFGSNIGSRFFVELGVPVIRGNNLTTDMTRFIDAGFVFVTEEKADELKNCDAIIDDLIFTAAGSLGQVGIIPKTAKYSRYIISNKQLRARVDKQKVDPLFAFYWLSSKEMVKYIQQRNTGSSVPLINLSVLRSLPIPLPPLPEQRAIAHILGTLDDKIELNRRMNETLEAMARAIFKSWFIDFEFPDENGQPYKSSGGEMVDSELGEIPMGWEAIPLGEGLKLLKDGSHNPPKRIDSGIRFVAGATNIKNFSIDFSSCTFISKEDYEKMHNKWIIEPNDVLLTIVGTVGNVALVHETDLPFSLQRSVAVLRSIDELSSLYLYYLIKSSYFQSQMSMRINPTAQPGIYLGELSKIPVLKPQKGIINNFDAILKQIISKMRHNLFEMDSAEKIRDSLLPKLMSGKIRIGGI